MASLQYETIRFNDIDFCDPIFNSIKIDYPNFLEWQNHAAMQSDKRKALVVRSRSSSYEGVALLKVGEMPNGETGASIKISTFKVTKSAEGRGIADLLLSGIFQVAVLEEIALIFITVLPSHSDLIRYLERKGFRCSPQLTKNEEHIYIADLTCSERIYPALNRIAYNLLADEYAQRAECPGPSQESAIDLADILLSNLQRPIGRVLELGPGSGDVLAQLSTNSEQTIAVEISPNMASIARRRVPEALMIVADIFDIDFSPESFDGVYAGAFIHLFPRSEARRLVKKIAQWLKPSGTLMINTSVAIRNSESIELKTDYLRRVARFRSRWTEREFKEILVENDFKVIDRKTTDEQERGKYWVAYVCRRVEKE